MSALRQPGPQARPHVVLVRTHRRVGETTEALGQLIAAAAQANVTLRFDAEETRKHSLAEHPDVSGRPGIELDSEDLEGVDLCLVLGGDGSILSAIAQFSGTGVPVFAVNFGQIGFLATIEPSELDEGLRRAFAGEFDLLRLPGIRVDTPGTPTLAFNDVAIHRKVGDRVAEIAYALDGEELGSVRCDGLVVSTPAGSTGYNLANGGPVMAWGVAGFVISFIAPHSLTARALVAAPDDPLTVLNRSREPLECSVDGRIVCEIAPEAAITAQFVDAAGTIAQMPGSSFYRRLREKFGRLAS